MAMENLHPKTQVVRFLQLYTGRSVQKSDFWYETGVVTGGYQSTVTLAALGGDQFVGEVMATAKDAEVSASLQVTAHYESLIAELSVKKGKNKSSPGVVVPPAKKQKTAGGAGVVVPPNADGAIEAIAPWPLASEEDEANNMAPEQVGVQPGTGDPNTPKNQLNMACMKILRRPMAKGEISYDTQKVSGGHQSTVHMPNMSETLGGDEMNGVNFAGEVCATPKEAEQSAATYAVQAITADPGCQAHMEAPASAKTKQAQKNKREPKIPKPTRLAIAVTPGPLPPGTTFGGQIQMADAFINENMVDAEAADGVVAEAAAPVAQVVPPPMSVGGVAAVQAAAHDTHKRQLNECCMKILRREMTKGEIAYETQKVGRNYQSTVAIPNLSEEFQGVGFTGEVSGNAKDAEQSAANYAVQAIMADPNLQAVMHAPPSAKVKQMQKNRERKGKGTEKGKGKGKGKGKKGKMWQPSFDPSFDGDMGLEGGPNPNFMPVGGM